MMEYLMKRGSGRHANKLDKVTFIFLDMELAIEIWDYVTRFVGAL